MKTIGLLGGMSWESSSEYYRLINQQVQQRLCGLHSAQCVMYSVDFAEIEALQQQGAWKEAGRVLADVFVKRKGSQLFAEKGAISLIVVS